MLNSVNFFISKDRQLNNQSLLAWHRPSFFTTIKLISTYIHIYIYVSVKKKLGLFVGLLGNEIKMFTQKKKLNKNKINLSNKKKLKRLCLC